MKYNEQDIITRYNNNETTVEIAKSLSTYNTTIRRILLRNKITLRSTSQVIRIVKDNPFSIENGNYWLGWLASDGCLTNGNIVLEVKAADSYILEKYIEYINYPLNINKSYSKKFDKWLSRVSFRNNEAYIYLRSIGITERKSRTLEVSFPINWEFLRGVIDGDGSIGFTNKGKGRKLEIASASIKFIEQIGNFYSSKNIRYTIRNNKKGLWLISVYSYESLETCYNEMIKEDSIFLIRKWSRLATLFRNKQDTNLAKTGNPLPAIPC